MLPKNNAFINTCISEGNPNPELIGGANYNSILRPAFFVEVFEGSIYDWEGAKNSNNGNDVVGWHRVDCSGIKITSQQGQSRTMSVSFPMPMFKTNDVLNKDYETGIYFGQIDSLLDQNISSTDTMFRVTSTGLIVVGCRIMIGSEVMLVTYKNIPTSIITVQRAIHASSHTVGEQIYRGSISKGYIIRGYEGYCDNTAPTFTENVVRKFTGVIESVILNDEGILEVNATDFSTIFINSLNYNYPDINSYRDMPYVDTTAVLTSDINSTTDKAFTVDDHTLIHFGTKIKIDSEVMLVLDVSSVYPYYVTVQRLAGVSAHLAISGVHIYEGDSLLVGPEDVYNDTLLSKYVPTYDNWLVSNAVKDICIKAKFPLSMLSLLFADQDKLRLGRSEKYPFMKSKPMFETVLTQDALKKSFARNYNNTGNTGYPSTVEKKVYLGIDQDMLGEAKFKMEFGKSLWDCLLAILDGFGFKIFFDENGKLTIRAVRQYKWLPAIETGAVKTNIVENNFWGWQAWHFDLITPGDPLRFSANFPSTTKNIKFRFATTDFTSTPIEVLLMFNNGGTWESIGGTSFSVPSLLPYQYYELESYRAERDVTVFPAGQYAVLIVGGMGTKPIFNGFLYLDNADEVVSFECLSTLNAQINSVVDSATEVRNKMTIIGKPKSPQPIVTSVTDTPSIYGGSNVIYLITDGTTNYTKNSILLDGKTDKFVQILTKTKPLGVAVIASNGVNMKTLILYLKPQTTAVGIDWISIESTGNVDSFKNIREEDLTSQGIVFNFVNPVSNLKIHSSTDLYVSEIQGYSDDPAYNFVGFKKETLVIKDNISDSATADWLALSLLELYRRNVQSVSFPIVGNPYLQLGDCISCAAPELGIYYNYRLWITGISSDIKKLGYIDTLTVSALPPTQSYTLPPDPDVSQFTDSPVYDYSITKKTTATNAFVEQVSGINAGGTLIDDITAIQTLFSLHGLTPTPSINIGTIIQIDMEHMLVTNLIIYGDHKDLQVDRAISGTIAATHSAGAKIYLNASIADVTFPDQYLTFNFALPKPQKVQIIVGVVAKNQNIAYVMEEKVLDAGVYKRENGIRWDGGIDFAKVWPETVDKIYLFPPNDYNYMYNRMFHLSATTEWENANNNYDWWKYEDPKTSQAANSGWMRTPSSFEASLVVKPILNGYNGVASVAPTVTKIINIVTSCPVYKVKWGNITPVNSSASAYQPVTATLVVTKDGNQIDLNDAVYLDAYVTKGDGGNVNLQASLAGADTSRRWITPISLVSYIQWDFTDSQGKTVASGTIAKPQTYKFGILNCFDIYGRGVEVANGGGTINLMDGSLKISANSWNKGPTASSLVAEGFEIKIGQFPSTDRQSVAGSFINGKRDNTSDIYFKLDLQTSGGQQGDSYPRIKFIKKAKASAWPWDSVSDNAPVLILTNQSMFRNIYPGGEWFYLRFFFQSSAWPVSLMTSYKSIYYPPYPGHSGHLKDQFFTLHDVWQTWVVIQYIDSYNVFKKFYKVLPNRTTTYACPEAGDGTWHPWYTAFHTSEISDCVAITGCGLQMRAGSIGGGTTEFDSVVFDEIWLGIDSIEFAAGQGPDGPDPPPTYTDPAGGPRISSKFNYTA